MDNIRNFENIMSVGKNISLNSLKTTATSKFLSYYSSIKYFFLVIKQTSTIFEHILHCPLVSNKKMDAILVKYTNYQSWYYHADY